MPQKDEDPASDVPGRVIPLPERPDYGLPGWQRSLLTALGTPADELPPEPPPHKGPVKRGRYRRRG